MLSHRTLHLLFLNNYTNTIHHMQANLYSIILLFIRAYIKFMHMLMYTYVHVYKIIMTPAFMHN